jgi:hypothetical protein
MKTKFPAFLLIIILSATQVNYVAAQGNKPPANIPTQLTLQQMQTAVTVSDGSAESRSGKPGQIYRLANCDENNPDAPCYFTITGGTNFVANTNSVVSPLSSSTTISCGVNIYGTGGVLGATLQQNVYVTFWGTYGQTPVTLNSGNLNGTASFMPLWWWSDLTGPNPSPGWGVYVSRTGVAQASAGGLLNRGIPPIIVQQWFSTTLTINRYGYYCG